MSGQGEHFPRAGVASDLHEWAKQLDAKQSEAINNGLQAAVDRLYETVANIAGIEVLADEQKSGVDASLSDIFRLSAAKAQHEFGPRMTDVFDGDAMNA